MEKIETPVSRKEELTVLVIVCLGTFFHVQSMGSIQVALPSIQKEFDSSLAAIQWIGMMGAITLSSLSLCFGRGADLVGRKRFFKMGLSLYALGAGLAALSASFSQLLTFRFVMTVGLVMATLPLTTALTSPLSGRLADRMNARFVAIAGLCFLLVGIFLYASLGTDSEQLQVVVALALVGVGLGLFTPANEKLAFSFLLPLVAIGLLITLAEKTNRRRW